MKEGVGNDSFSSISFSNSSPFHSRYRHLIFSLNFPFYSSTFFQLSPPILPLLPPPNLLPTSSSHYSSSSSSSTIIQLPPPNLPLLPAPNPPPLFPPLPLFSRPRPFPPPLFSSSSIIGAFVGYISPR